MGFSSGLALVAAVGFDAVEVEDFCRALGTSEIMVRALPRPYDALKNTRKMSIGNPNTQ